MKSNTKSSLRISSKQLFLCFVSESPIVLGFANIARVLQYVPPSYQSSGFFRSSTPKVDVDNIRKDWAKYTDAYNRAIARELEAHGS